ncbi:MAG: transcription-repair coupling factor [Rickettsiales bacterium]
MPQSRICATAGRVAPLARRLMPLSPAIINGLKPGIALTVAPIPFAAQAQLLCDMVAESQRPLVHVLTSDKDMATLAALCGFIRPEITVLMLPAWDTLPYDRVSPSAAITATRLATLSALATAKPSDSYILLTTVNAATQKLPPRSLFAQARFVLTKGHTLQRDALFQFLERNGYQRRGKVMEAGEFAVRGSLIDLFAPGHDEAVRIDLFGDEIESLRHFDPLTQISDQPLDTLELRPVSEVLLQPDTIARFRERYLELFGAVTRDDPLYESISAGRTASGMEHWLPLFYERLDTLADYAPGAILSLDSRVGPMQEERSDTIADYYQARLSHHGRDSAPYHPVPSHQLFLDANHFDRSWAHQPQLTLSAFAVDGAVDLGFRSSPQLSARRHVEGAHPVELIQQFIADQKKPVILAANSAGSADRIAKMLEIPPPGGGRLGGGLNDAETLPLTPPPQPSPSGGGSLSLVVLPVEQGYETPDYLLLTEQDMFGERIIRTQKKRRKSEAFLAEAASFVEGEHIVHREHGIGRFEGLITVEVNDTKHDCLKLIYDGGTLFLPVENIDLVSRYGAAEEGLALDKLGGVAWQKRKSALKKRLKMAAEALLKVAAERAAIVAPALKADIGAYDEFVARFPYTETEDQLQAIDDVRADLLAGRAMDRLVCGDVGFGKTEVALRTAFIAASDGQQVAIIAPTTLLARQHFHTFTTRFRDLPFTIRMLSRLTKPKDAAQTKLDLTEGKVDIVIGTHALLANSIQFKKLGLLIVDEEQHFGVAQKEKLKALKADVHVLTLSATPIPRTLQLSLSGVRELSLITTPPVDRLAVRTYVMPFDPVVLREAILREYHRGGKVFYVTPRVKYMAELREKIATLVPEIKIAAAHGQMGAVALDKIMNEFYDGKYDLLLSTSIIESGIDIPTANTMIIDRADMFGLSQLYQLRGRVGRSKQRAYAYLTLPYQKKLTRDAERRLEVMQQLDSLGAGFQLASHDMDIRGFGNLLGEEQSGHIKEVGIELYQAMLEEAIADLRKRNAAKLKGTADDSLPVTMDWSPQINLGMSVLIPETYVEDLPLRLSLYRRAAGLASVAELESFAAELVDRFGGLPIEVEHLIATLNLKIICKAACIARMDAGPKGVVLAFRDNKFAAPDALIAHIAKHTGRIKLRADQTLFITADNNSEAARLINARAIAGEIANLLPAPASQAA